MSVHIVVVEDESSLLDMFDALLTGEGFSVTTVPRPVLAKTAWPSAVDLFLIDLRLPDCDGTKLAGWLAAHGFRDTPMIGTSASSSEARRAARSGRFQVVLPKPFDTSELVACVRSHTSLDNGRSHVTHLAAHRQERARACTDRIDE